MIGSYIDALSDEQRDRIIEAKDFNDRPMSGYFYDGCGCLVAVAEMEHEEDSCPINIAMVNNTRTHPFGTYPGNQFPALCERFGKDRIIALCKARAARGNRLHEIRSQVYRALVPVGGMNGRIEHLEAKNG